MSSPLFDEDFLRRLESLQLAVRRRSATEPEGAILTRRRGQSLEFQEHRPYVPGDEFRHIDWNLACRFDSLFVKQFSREEGRLVCLVVDRSASMGFGEPAKLGAALRAAAALGVLALAGSAAVRVFQTGETVTGSDPFRGEGMRGPFFDALSRVTAGGPGSPARAIQAVLRELTGPATVILFSDLWDDDGVVEAVRDLAGRSCEAALLRFLAPEEIEPDVAGKVSLVDSETGLRHRLYVGDEERAAYKTLLESDDARWKAACAAHRVPFVRVSSAVPATELVMVLLREAGVVR